MALPDYRIRFPSNLMDFDEEVHGGSPDGQDINNFPEPGQARYDWMRMVVIGLLANQSSIDEPTQRKIGTLWMDLNDRYFKYFDGTEFKDLANAIKIGDGSLVKWSELVDNTVGKVTEISSFSGTAAVSGVVEISIPSDCLNSAAYSNNHPVLYKNGLLTDPRLTSFNTDRDKVLLLDNEFGSVELRKNDKYIIIIQRLDIVVPDTIVVS